MHHRPVAALVVVAMSASAQEPVSPASAARALAEVRAPIHSHPDDPLFGPYGTWAAGPDYKVSFHDGFTFYPLLGPACPENLPLAWRTESVRIGGDDLLDQDEQPERHSAEWRYEYRYRAVTEAYDVRRDGVEQTFVLATRPAAAGDLVVTGRIATRLVLLPQVAAEPGLTFGDAAGQALVRYGAAFAVDARGDRIAVPVAYRDGRIELRVAGAWLATATFPVVLDPLTARVGVVSGGSRYVDLDVAHDGTNSTANSVVVTFVQAFSASDFDAYAVMTGADFASTSTIFSDIVPTTSSDHTRVAFVGGSAQRWAIAFQRTGFGVSGVRMWAHDRGNRSPSAGALMILAAAAGTTNRYPDVGGEMGILPVNARGLVVYQSDVTTTNANTSHTEVYGAFVDLNTRTFGTPFLLANSPVGTTLDRERPSVTQVPTYPGVVGSWVAVWQELNRGVANDFWDIYGQRISAQGARAAQGRITPNSLFQSHRVAPEVAGSQGRYMVAYRTALDAQSLLGDSLQVTRFDAPESATTLTPLQLRTIVPPVSGTEILSHHIAHDRITHSHWAISYDKSGPGAPYEYASGIIRVGATGGIVESATLGTNNTGAASPSVTYLEADPAVPSPGFLTVYNRSVILTPPSLNGTTLFYSGHNQAWGTGCGGTIGASEPYAGNDRFHVTLAGANPPVTSAILLLSAAGANLSLDGAGMPGCSFYVDPAFFVTFVDVTSGGYGQVGIALPDVPLFVGRLYFQWLYVSPGSNAAGLLATGGMYAEVR